MVEAVPEPTALPVPTAATGETIRIKYSWYFPALGGPNCSNFVNGQCISNMASGLAWADYLDYGLACPPQWPFHTKLILDNKTYECLDRGGLIQFDSNGLTYVDFLTEAPAYNFGQILEVRIIYP